MRYTALNVTFKRCLHTSNPSFAAKSPKVALSKFEPNSHVPYEKLSATLSVVKSRLNRPLTLSEKILYSHLSDPEGQVSQSHLRQHGPLTKLKI
ncbi:aconitate mitochondrial-like [Brachionus plicatilis]|uniref:Aconitate mitochondrial-like n=1 Tax=Brachionus plicatilis TaxID=10195 RepID=A0A3M7Q8I8_BRAPC|nr:aconitate mitochondrial-like [Brachionus plicatilis]